MILLKKIEEVHLDILKEIGNIGAGNAATALSKMIHHSVDMEVPFVRVISFDEITQSIGGDETIVAAVYFRIEGDAPGSMFFLLPIDQAATLITNISGKQVLFNKPPYDEIAISALMEVGNILTGSYLSSLADFTKLNLKASVPAVGIDMAGALLNYGLLHISPYSDYAVVIDTTFSEYETSSPDVNVQVLLLPDAESFQIIFSALGVAFDE